METERYIMIHSFAEKGVKLRILDKIFIKNNKNKGKLIINNKKSSLKDFISTNENKIKISLLLNNNISNKSEMFKDCKYLKKYQ